MRDRLLTGLGPNVIVLGLVSLFTDISSEMIYPLIPLFLVSVLGASYVDVGTIEGIAESTASILNVFSGWLSDRWGRRKPITVVGYGVSALAKPLLALTSSWPQVLVTRFLDRFGKGVRTAARDALIAESSDERWLGKAFGFHRAADTIGAVVGPLLASVFIALSFGFRDIFLIAFVPALIGVVLILLFVREAPHPSPQAEESLRQARLNPTYLNARFKTYLLVLAIFAIGNSSDVFIILRAQNVGVPLVIIPLLYVAMNLVYALVSFPAGMLSDRVGRRPIILSGYLIFALTYAGFAFVSNVTQMWALIALYGVYNGFTEAAAKAYAADLSEGAHLGTYFGFYNSVIGVFALPASIIAGLLWMVFGAPSVFIYGTSTAFIALVLLLVAPAVLARYERRRNEV
ncbi:MAG: MFS transporter [Halobacteriota archaeon]